MEEMINQETFSAESQLRSISPEQEAQPIKPKIHSANFAQQGSTRRKCATSMNVRKSRADTKLASGV